MQIEAVSRGTVLCVAGTTICQERLRALAVTDQRHVLRSACAQKHMRQYICKLRTLSMPCITALQAAGGHAMYKTALMKLRCGGFGLRSCACQLRVRKAHMRTPVPSHAVPCAPHTARTPPQDATQCSR